LCTLRSGKEPEKLLRYYGDLFGWELDTSAPVAEARGEVAAIERWSGLLLECPRGP